MSLFSFFRKNKQESTADDSAFYSRADEESKTTRGRRKRSAGGPARRNEAGADPVDPVLPEKKRARRRLIGAVALVLAAVVGLPMILDSEPKPLAEDIAIRIPSKDKPLPTASSGSSHPVPAVPVAKIVTSDALDPKEEVIDPADIKPPSPVLPAVAMADTRPRKDEKIDPAKAIAAEKPAPKAEAKAASSKSDSKAGAKTESKAESGPQDGARAKALLEGRPDPKAAEKKSGKFVIQVAALATKEKVDELQVKLKGAGIPSFTQKVATESGQRTRIRVGPFGSKEEAEKMRVKIVKLGLNGTLVPLSS